MPQALMPPQQLAVTLTVAELRQLIPEELKLAVSHPATNGEKPYLTVKEASEVSGLGASTIRLAIRKRQLRAQRVGRRVLVKRLDLESFLQANPIEALND